MKKIKFRAWDKKEELMYDVVVLQRDEFVGVPVVGPDGWELSKRKLKDVELMQFTGLLDRNGVEIYEGDILMYRKITEETRVMDVKTRKFITKKRKTPKIELHYYEVFMSDKGQWKARRNLGMGGMHETALYGMIENHEVSGNIHQNPELLANAKNI